MGIIYGMDTMVLIPKRTLVDVLALSDALLTGLTTGSPRCPALEASLTGAIAHARLCTVEEPPIEVSL